MPRPMPREAPVTRATGALACSDITRAFTRAGVGREAESPLRRRRLRFLHHLEQRLAVLADHAHRRRVPWVDDAGGRQDRPVAQPLRVVHAAVAGLHRVDVEWAALE